MKRFVIVPRYGANQLRVRVDSWNSRNENVRYCSSIVPKIVSALILAAYWWK
jgi:hypothetical protein